MKIMGTFLPFIGFRTFPIDNEGMPVLEGGENSPWESDCFMLEWFGLGVILFTTGVRHVRKTGADHRS